MNICGVLIHAHPAKVGDVMRNIAPLAGVEVHGTAPGGRIIVTVEDTPTLTALDAMAALHRLDGVVAASLIYHHFEPDAEGAAATA